MIQTIDGSPPRFPDGRGGTSPPRILKGRGGNLGCPPPDFTGGEFGRSPPAKRGEKILVFFSCPPRFLTHFTPVTGGLGHFRVPPPVSTRGEFWMVDAGGQISDSVPPRLPRSRGGNVLSPPVFREAGGGIHLCFNRHKPVLNNTPSKTK